MWLVVFPLAAWAQAPFTVRGKVSDSKGEALTGVSVAVSGTTFGVPTNADGTYSFSGSLPAGSYTVVYSYIGYLSESKKIDIVTGGTNTFDVDTKLVEDVLSLNEVVVIGSTVTQERKQLGNTITSIKADQITGRGTGDPLQSLQGKIAGAQITQNSGDPSGGISVKLRGAKSILSSSEPLYVIDGVVVSNATRNVTNVNVDAGQGSAIGQNRMADINPNDIESIEVINGAAAAAIYGSRASNGVVLITTKRGKEGKPEVNFSTAFTVSELRKKVPITTYPYQFGSAGLRLNIIADNDPTLPGTQLATNLVEVPGRYDYQDDVFRTGYGTENNISIAGGNENTKYFASVNYLYNQGIVRNSDFRRIGGRVRIEQKLNKWLTASAGINYNNSFSNEKPNGNVFWSPVNAVNITNNIYNIRERDAAGNLQAVEPTRVNPLSVIEDFDITQETNRTIGDLQLIATPFAGFKLNYVLGVDYISQFGKIFIPRYPYAGVNVAFFNDGYASSASSPVSLINNDINLSYSKEAGQFSFTTYGGYNHQFSKDRYVVAQGRNLAPFVENVNGAATPLQPIDARGITQIYGFYLQEVIGYKNQLFLTLAGRIDGSTAFSSDNRSLFYPKASVSYVLSDTDWWANLGLKTAVSQFKLRGSYGEAGNLTGIGAYDRFYRYNTTSFLGVSAINAGTTLANPDVKPERQKEIEFGTDLSFLQNRLGLTFTWYKQDISDLLIDRTVAPSQGGTGIRTNIGKLENKGFELAINATVLQKENLKWSLFGTFSRNRNRVTQIPQALISITNPTGAPVFILPGEAVGVFYGFYYARDENGDLLLNAEGLPQRATDANGAFLRKVIGNPNPDFVWSLGSNLDFLKNFSFGFLLDAVYGNEVFNADKRTRQGVGIGDLAEKEYKGELPRGYINAVYPIEEFRIDDGSFVKIRELSLTYRLPKVIPAVNNLSISLMGRNIYSFDKYNGYDPETNAAGQSSVLRGIDFGNVPIPRTYQVALRASF